MFKTTLAFSPIKSFYFIHIFHSLWKYGSHGGNSIKRSYHL